jgi:hypothetical protein
MTSPTPVSGDKPLQGLQDFSLVLGGPLFQLSRRAHLTDDALNLVRQRIIVISLLCVVLGPLVVFAPQLAQAKWAGTREYGTLAQRYVREFDAKWLRGGALAEEPLVGSADIQSLADLANSFEVVRTMRLAPVTKEAVLQLAAATLLPVLPLALTMMSLEDLLKKLFGIIF